MEKSISQYKFNYYKYDQSEEFGWNQVNYWEYMQLDYADSDLLAATLSFAARSRSNDISNGFTTTETQNGEMGYWDLKYDQNSELVMTRFITLLTLDLINQILIQEIMIILRYFCITYIKVAKVCVH